MRRKLGLLQVDGAEEDQELVTDLLQVMHDTGADFTNTFRRLATFPMPSPTGCLSWHPVLITKRKSDQDNSRVISINFQV